MTIKIKERVKQKGKQIKMFREFEPVCKLREDDNKDSTCHNKVVIWVTENDIPVLIPLCRYHYEIISEEVNLTVVMTEEQRKEANDEEMFVLIDKLI